MDVSKTRKVFLQNGDRPTGVYAHVPFCARKCRYCDFHSVSYQPDLAERNADAMLTELRRRQDVLAHPIRTAFVGGGTPTVLPPATLARLLTALRQLGDDATELTVEANPNSLTDEILTTLIDAGVNRLSIGVQSFFDAELSILGRLHDARQARAAVAAARERLENVSLDLMYGIPGQTLDSWRASLDAALEFRPAHMSCYCLSFESGTPLAEDLDAGRVGAMDESLQRDCYELTIDTLAAAGLAQYEISNFARPGRECRHNLIYWHNNSYLGIGPWAVSYVDGRRTRNVAAIASYISRIDAGNLAEESSERITGRQLMAETLMLELRLRAGVEHRRFADRFGQDPAEAFSGPITRYVALGMLELTPTSTRLTRQGLFVADSVLADIVADAQP